MGGEVDGVGFAAGLKSHKVSGWAGYSGGTLWQLTGRWRIARSSFWRRPCEKVAPVGEGGESAE